MRILLLAFLLCVGTAHAQRGPDVQMSRDRSGNLNVQINPGAAAVGPFHNITPFNAPGLSVTGSYGQGGAGGPFTIDPIQVRPSGTPYLRSVSIERDGVVTYLKGSSSEQPAPASRGIPVIYQYSNKPLVCVRKPNDSGVMHTECRN